MMKQPIPEKRGIRGAGGCDDAALEKLVGGDLDGIVL